MVYLEGRGNVVINHTFSTVRKCDSFSCIKEMPKAEHMLLKIRRCLIKMDLSYERISLASEVFPGKAKPFLFFSSKSFDKCDYM